MNSLAWDLTIFGAMLCIFCSCLAGMVGRANGIRLCKIGLILGLIGTLGLASMAVVGPSHSSESGEPVIVMKSEQYVPQRNLLHKKLVSVYYRTLYDRGPRPSKNHVAFEDDKGKLSWILKENYVKILTKQYKEGTK